MPRAQPGISPDIGSPATGGGARVRALEPHVERHPGGFPNLHTPCLSSPEATRVKEDSCHAEVEWLIRRSRCCSNPRFVDSGPGRRCETPGRLRRNPPKSPMQNWMPWRRVWPPDSRASASGRAIGSRLFLARESASPSWRWRRFASARGSYRSIRRAPPRRSSDSSSTRGRRPSSRGPSG